MSKFKTLPSAGKVMFTVFWDRKGVILLDFLERGQTINSDRYIAVRLLTSFCTQKKKK
jgi:hypothetical protein